MGCNWQINVLHKFGNFIPCIHVYLANDIFSSRWVSSLESDLLISTICHHLVCHWMYGKMERKWFQIAFIWFKEYAWNYILFGTWEPLRIKSGYLFPSKFISKRPYIVLVKPKPKYHGSGVRGLRFDYMVVTSAQLFWEWRFEIE